MAIERNVRRDANKPKMQKKSIHLNSVEIPNKLFNSLNLLMPVSKSDHTTKFATLKRNVGHVSCNTMKLKLFNSEVTKIRFSNFPKSSLSEFDLNSGDRNFILSIVIPIDHTTIHYNVTKIVSGLITRNIRSTLVNESFRGLMRYLYKYWQINCVSMGI